MKTHRIILGALLLAACSDGGSQDPPDAGTGELGIGLFFYRCRGPGDFVCPTGQTGGDFPEAIALGAHFGLEYGWQSDSLGNPLPGLQSAAPSRMSQEGGVFTGLVPGYTAVLAVYGNTQVADLRHLFFREVDSLRMVDVPTLPRVEPRAELFVVVGESAEFQAVPFDTSDTPLAGSLDFVWSSGDDALVHIAQGGDTGRVRVEGRSVGTTTLTATLGDLQVSLPIRVEALESETTTGEPGTGSDTDTGTTTDSSTGTDTSTGTDESDTGSSDTGTDTDTTGGVL